MARVSSTCHAKLSWSGGRTSAPVTATLTVRWLGERWNSAVRLLPSSASGSASAHASPTATRRSSMLLRSKSSREARPAAVERSTETYALSAGIRSSTSARGLSGAGGHAGRPSSLDGVGADTSGAGVVVCAGRAPWVTVTMAGMIDRLRDAVRSVDRGRRGVDVDTTRGELR